MLLSLMQIYSFYEYLLCRTIRSNFINHSFVSSTFPQLSSIYLETFTFRSPNIPLTSHELFEHSSPRFFPQDLTTHFLSLFRYNFSTCTMSRLVFSIIRAFFIPPYLYLFISPPSVTAQCNFFSRKASKAPRSPSLLLLFLLDNRVFLIYRNQTMKLLSPAPFIKFLFHVSSTIHDHNLNRVTYFNKEKLDQLSQHLIIFFKYFRQYFSMRISATNIYSIFRAKLFSFVRLFPR